MWRWVPSARAGGRLRTCVNLRPRCMRLRCRAGKPTGETGIWGEARRRRDGGGRWWRRNGGGGMAAAGWQRRRDGSGRWQRRDGGVSLRSRGWKATCSSGGGVFFSAEGAMPRLRLKSVEMARGIFPLSVWARHWPEWVGAGTRAPNGVPWRHLPDKGGAWREAGLGTADAPGAWTTVRAASGRINWRAISQPWARQCLCGRHMLQGICITWSGVVAVWHDGG